MSNLDVDKGGSVAKLFAPQYPLSVRTSAQLYAADRADWHKYGVSITPWS